MHLGVLLGLVGQLIAVPAVLFFFPNARLVLNRSSSSPASLASTADSAESTALGGVDNGATLLTPVKQQGGILKKSDGDKSAVGRANGVRQITSEAGSRSLGQRASEAVGLLGLDAIMHTMEDVADGLRESLNNMVQPLVQPLVQPFHDIPRQAGDFFSAVTGRVAEEPTPMDLPDRTVRYLAELRLAQESAERALMTPGWDEAAQRDGITVWKKYFPKDEYGHQYPCVKARGIIDGSAEEVMGMIVDSTRVFEYNRYSKGRVDVEHIGPRTKIVWNKAQPPLTSKLHDFCTLMHVEPLDDGSFMLITRATEHPQAPLLDGHVRSEILLGITILKPVDGCDSRTEMTTVNHIVSNGIPVMIADRVSTKNAIDFIQNVESAVNVGAATSSCSSSSAGRGSDHPGEDSASTHDPAPAEGSIQNQRTASAA